MNHPLDPVPTRGHEVFGLPARVFVIAVRQVEDDIATVDSADQTGSVRNITHEHFGPEPRDPRRSREVANQRPVRQTVIERQHLAHPRANEPGCTGNQEFFCNHF